MKHAQGSWLGVCIGLVGESFLLGYILLKSFRSIREQVMTSGK